jgi:polysaccharide biosynthesis protein PslH
VRILILAPRAPFPANDGASQRNLRILRWLGSRDEVTLAAFGDPSDEAASCALGASAASVVIIPRPRRSASARVVDVLLTSQPDLTRRLWSRPMIRAVRRVCSETPFDLVQIEGLEMFSLWIAAGVARKTRPRVILDEHNAEYSLQASAAAASRANGSWFGALYSSIQAGRLRRYEQNAFRLVDGVVAVSKDDELALRALRPSVRSTVVPNGVDTTSFLPAASREPGERVLFIGKMDYRPNVDAAEWLGRQIWPRVRGQRPTATLEIVGRDPTPRVVSLGGIDGVTVVGEVPDERSSFQRASLLVVPMRMGSGVRLKVLQAMATATPIVSTAPGMSGTGAVDGIHYLRGDSPGELATAVVRVLEDAALRAQLANASLDLVRSHYDWSAILPRLDEFHREIIENA